MKVGLGVTTYNRPEMAEKCIKAIVRNLKVDDHYAFDYLYVYDDGSDPKYNGAYSRAFRPLVGIDGTKVLGAENRGVAYAKNRLLDRMMHDGCDWLFLCEDDIKVLDAKAITEYVRVCKATDFHHLSFAHHGPANSGGPVATAGDVAYYPHSIGAWTCFSRQALETVGLFDENFVRAWEHVEHTLRLILGGFMPGADVHKFPDVAGSNAWLQEVPGSIEKSSIRPRDDWHSNIRDGLIYWQSAKPDTFAMLFGPDKPLHAYAQSIIGSLTPA